jgi:hypothetical protein
METLWGMTGRRARSLQGHEAALEGNRDGRGHEQGGDGAGALAPSPRGTLAST